MDIFAASDGGSRSSSATSTSACSAVSVSMPRVGGVRINRSRSSSCTTTVKKKKKAREIVKRAGIPVTDYGFTTDPAQARQIAERIGGRP